MSGNRFPKDCLLAAGIGSATALFLVPTLYNMHLGGVALYTLLFVTLPVLWVSSTALSRFLGRFVPALYQFAKFAMVGFLNTVIDFGILNTFSFATGLTAGLAVGGVNVPGFLIASVNSYAWNKFWVFGAGANRYGDIVSFALAVGLGVFLNSGIVVAITAYLSPLVGFSAHAWLNIAKAVATVVTLFWHFFAFKFLVFRVTSHPNDA